jgi:hypothetical protein
MEGWTKLSQIILKIYSSMVLGGIRFFMFP